MNVGNKIMCMVYNKVLTQNEIAVENTAAWLAGHLVPTLKNIYIHETATENMAFSHNFESPTIPK